MKDNGRFDSSAAAALDMPNPDRLLSALGVTPHDLAEAYLFDSNPVLREQLSQRLELICNQGELLGQALCAGDLLLRAMVGEGHVMLAVLVDGEVLERGAAERQGWDLESNLPGRYALVVGHALDRFGAPRARRITDQNNNVPAGQALLRTSAVSDAQKRAAQVNDLIESITTGAPTLQSTTFAADPDLSKVAAGGLRLAGANTAPWPAPVLSEGPAVAKVQQALIDLGYPLPHGGADGKFGDETGSAVTTFKEAKHIAPSDPVVGRATITALDAAMVECGHPLPPTPDPSPPAPGPAPPAPTVRLQPGDHVWYYNGQICTDRDIPRRRWFPLSAAPSDFCGHGGEIYNYVVHAAGQIYCGQPHMRGRPGTFAWLNNNPGNLTGRQDGAFWGQYRNKFNWHHFLIFPSFSAGFDAIALFLRNGGYPAKTTGARQWGAGKYRNLSITEAFHRYAPEGDGGNNPDLYGAQVAAAAGVPEATLVGSLNDDQMRKMQDKIFEIEGTRRGTILTTDDPGLPSAVRAVFA